MNKFIRYSTIVICVLLIMSLILGGCGSKSIDVNDDEYANLYSFGEHEWISPDGVHYWVFVSANKYGIAPRYDCNGSLIIDKQ